MLTIDMLPPVVQDWFISRDYDEVDYWGAWDDLRECEEGCKILSECDDIDIVEDRRDYDNGYWSQYTVILGEREFEFDHAVME